MPDQPTPEQTLFHRALVVLAEPLTEGDLLTTLGLRSGTDEAAALLGELLADSRVASLGDGRLASAVALLDGLVLWHRLDAVEVATRRIGFGIDVEPALALLARPTDVLVGDDVVPLVEWPRSEDLDLGRGPTIHIPEGWGDVVAGDLVALTFDGLRPRLHQPDDPTLPTGTGRSGAGSAEADALGTALARLASSRGRLLTILSDPERDSADQWLLDLELHGGILVADHGQAVRALHRLPLREAIVRAGCSSMAAVVGGPAVSSRSLETFMVGWTVAVDVCTDDPAVFEACGVVVGALCGSATADGSPYDERATAHALRTLLLDPLVAQIVVDHLRCVHLGPASEAERRLRPVQRAHPGEPGPAWVSASVLLRQGRGHEALALLDRVVCGFDDDGFDQWPLLVRCAAHLRAAAGDLTSAIDLSHRSQWHDDADELERWVLRPPRVGRNERCPCGSGAKAKACCLHSFAMLSIARRLPLLWHKISGWAMTQDCGGSTATLVASRLIDPASPTAIVQAMAAFDVHLLEGEGVAAVLDGVTLPGVAHPDAA